MQDVNAGDIMSITKNTEYALRALFEITETGNGKPISRKMIAEKQNISESFLEKLFISLQRAGLISSVHGPGGGFVLGKNAGEITVWDVFSAVENKAHYYEKCAAVNQDECERLKKCKIKHVWSKINQVLKDGMTGISLKDISSENLFADNLETGGEQFPSLNDREVKIR